MRMLSVTGLLLINLVLGGPKQAAAPSQSPTIYDEDVKLVTWAEISYPELPYRARIQGAVVIRVTLDGDGNVKDASALSGSKLFVPACLINAKKWKFHTSEKSALIVYDFRMDSGVCVDGSLFAVHPPNFVTVTGCTPLPEP